MHDASECMRLLRRSVDGATCNEIFDIDGFLHKVFNRHTNESCGCFCESGQLVYLLLNHQLAMGLFRVAVKACVVKHCSTILKLVMF